MPGSRRGRLLVALALAAAALAGCSGDEEPRGTVNVAMYDNFFAREVTRVPAGTRVRFPNRGRTAHNAVAADGSWRTPDRVGADEAAAVVLDRPGVYRFYCTFHATRDGRQGMAATLVVGDVPYYPGQEEAGPALRPVKRASGTVRRVPEDHDTIQAAVDAAGPGDLVLVGPGTYREEVKVAVPSVTIRGRDRDRVVVDGEFRRPNGISVTADGVAVENLTVRNALINGLFWTGVRGSRVDGLSGGQVCRVSLAVAALRTSSVCAARWPLGSASAAVFRSLTKVSQSPGASRSPEVISKKSCWMRSVMGPRRPSPTWMRSTLRMGVISAAVPEKNTSSAT